MEQYFLSVFFSAVPVHIRMPVAGNNANAFFGFPYHNPGFGVPYLNTFFWYLFLRGTIMK